MFEDLTRRHHIMVEESFVDRPFAFPRDCFCLIYQLHQIDPVPHTYLQQLLQIVLAVVNNSRVSRLVVPSFNTLLAGYLLYQQINSLHCANEDVIPLVNILLCSLNQIMRKDVRQNLFGHQNYIEAQHQ